MTRAPLTLFQSCSPPVSSGPAYLSNDERDYGDDYFFSDYSPESFNDDDDICGYYDDDHMADF